jgi:ankyrin repeat protein
LQLEDLVILLLENGALPNFVFFRCSKNNLRPNKIPLHSAIMSNNISIVNHLLRAGADPNLKDY